jgi:hypothetical protein
MNGFYIILQLAFIIQMCSSQQYGDVRLVDGEDPSNGCLELFTRGLPCQHNLDSWQPVCCNNFFNLNETAATVCRQMGYKTVESLTV